MVRPVIFPLIFALFMSASVLAQTPQYHWSQDSQGNIYYTAGSVGIGIQQPQAKLDISGFTSQTNTHGLVVESEWGSSNPMVLFSSTHLGGSGSADGAVLKLESDSNRSDMMLFQVAGPTATHFAVTGAGDVGVGTDTPGATLDITGFESSSNQSGLRVSTSSWGNISTPMAAFETTGDGMVLRVANRAYQSNRNIMEIDNAGGPALRVRGNGNVGIKTATPQYPLDVNGTIRADQFLTTSDRRFKTDITTIPNALERALDLRGVTYHWKDTARGTGLQLGFIAQEVEQIFPELVKTDSTGYKSMAYAEMSAVLIEALKAQQVRFDEQQPRLEQLQSSVAQLDSLEARLNELESAISRNSDSPINRKAED